VTVLEAQDVDRVCVSAIGSGSLLLARFAFPACSFNHPAAHADARATNSVRPSRAANVEAEGSGCGAKRRVVGGHLRQ
jgi:hypothetical protein